METQEFHLFNLDKHRLDEECEKQVKMFAECVEDHARASSKHDAMEAALKEEHARLYHAVRKSPETYGLDKATEAAVETMILLQPTYQEAAKKLRIARLRMNRALNAVKIMDQRKKSIELLVQLHLANYFSAPRIPKEVQEAKVSRAFSKGKKGGEK